MRVEGSGLRVQGSTLTPQQKQFLGLWEEQAHFLGLLWAGVPRSLETTPPSDPTAGLCLGPYGGPGGGGAVSYERDTPVLPLRTE